MSLPVVSAWRQSGAQFVKVGQVGAYTSLAFTPTFNDAGSWSLTAPYDVGRTVLPGRLVTIDWRGVRSTWLIDEFHPSQGEEGGDTVLTVSGAGAKAMLAWCLAWPNATRPIELQPNYRANEHAPYSGPFETVMRQLVAQNFRDRRGAPLVLDPDGARGATVKIRPNFENLFELITTQASAKTVGFDIGLVNTTATTATLRMWFYTPADKSKSVRLKSSLGTIAAWEQADTAPAATTVIVGVGDEQVARTTLARDISASTNQIKVSSSKDFPTPGGDTPAFRVIVESESMTVTAVGGKATTHLSSAVTATDKTIPVDSVGAFPDPPFAAQVGTESINVTDISGTTLTVVRGVGSDKPTAHSNNVSVTADLSAYWTVTRGVGSTSPASHSAGDRVSLTRYFRAVSNTSAHATATSWGGEREVYLAGPSTNDTGEIDDAGAAVLSDGAETRALSVVASEAEGMQAFIHYTVGDIASAEVLTGASAVANISAIDVSVDDSGVSVKPVFGNPGSVNSSLKLAEIIRTLGRAVRKNERK